MPVSLYFYLIVSAAFMLVLLISGWAIRKYSKISIFEKIAYILVLLGFAIFVPYSVFSIMGLPTLIKFNSLPSQMRLLGVENSFKDDIFIWITTKDSHVPMSYQVVELQKKDRELLSEAKKMLKKGKPVILEKAEKGDAEGEGDGGTGTSKKGRKEKGDAANDSLEVSEGNFRIRKEFAIPPKTDEPEEHHED